MKNIINVTPHPIVFRGEDGDFTVESYCIINATPMEEVLKVEDGIEYLKTVFIPSKEGLEKIEEIKKEFPDAIIVGSAIASQAYEEIVSLTPAKGTSRTDRIYSSNRFTVGKV